MSITERPYISSSDVKNGGAIQDLVDALFDRAIGDADEKEVLEEIEEILKNNYIDFE